MKKTIFLSSFLALIFLFFTVPNLWASDYQHSLKINEMDFSWNLNETTMDIRISAETTGWVGIGFNPEESMLGANIIIGYVKKGKARIEDHYGIRKRAHAPDEKQDGTSNITNPEGSEENGITTLSFTIPLNSGDQYDPPVKTDGPNVMIFAHGEKRDSLRTRHSFRTTWEINLKTGEGKEL
ncbi:DOMON domain-containing protein [Desulfospira joergensenii]|uniref:DOMON domain-containing protein n=1 Tax=Desulfospira joergensenii TaxID=53329 RepID=UPI0003B36F02|nr:DOMON domain-containing protein [Desulfospira joergensenii]